MFSEKCPIKYSEYGNLVFSTNCFALLLHFFCNVFRVNVDVGELNSNSNYDLGHRWWAYWGMCWRRKFGLALSVDSRGWAKYAYDYVYSVKICPYWSQHVSITFSFLDSWPERGGMIPSPFPGWYQSSFIQPDIKAALSTANLKVPENILADTGHQLVITSWKTEITIVNYPQIPGLHLYFILIRIVWYVQYW